MRRDGVGSSNTEVHKAAELEACQRLLESGSIGARIYEGPSVVGAFRTRQDQLLSEMKWVAVDVFEQRKLAVAHCRSLSGMIQKYWSERSRGSLSGAASMVQAYWISVAKEIRAPLPASLKHPATFKLNTLQSIRPSGSPRTSASVPSSLLPTPMATSVLSPNGLIAPPSEEMLAPSTNKKALAHGMVHDWLADREVQNPPLAEGTTGLADFCVQILKHHLREDHTGRAIQRQSSSQLPAADSPQHAPVQPPLVSHDFLIPLDSFSTHPLSTRAAVLAATEWAVQQILSQRGVDGLRCHESFTAPPAFDHRALLSPAALEAHKAVLQEIVATNIMSRSPQLFGLAANLAASLEQAESARLRKPQAADPKRRRSGEDNNNNATNKHYFVSVIFSTFTPLPWEPVEDAFLREAVRRSPPDLDWDLVATTVNWRTRAWLGYDLLRSAAQCQDRSRQLAAAGGADGVSTDASRRKKLAIANSAAFVPVRIEKRRAASGQWRGQQLSGKIAANEREEIDTVHPFLVTKGQMPSQSLNTFERRGVFAVAKPPTSFLARSFFHPPLSVRAVLTATGAATERRATLGYAFSAEVEGRLSGEVERSPVEYAKAVLSSRTVPVHSPVVLIEEAREEEAQRSQNLVAKIIAARQKIEPVKRAFSVEDLVRKNSAAVPGNVPQYISGQLVCPPHPSFANMTRIAEMTLARLINSVADQQQAPPPVPMPIEALFQYCALFRKKYPAVFTSQHKVTKPSMPQLRPGMPPGTKMVTRQQAVAARQPTPAPVQPQPVQVTQPEPLAESTAAATWLRPNQRQKRTSGVPTRNANSPDTETPTPAPPPEASFMAAGGPSLYGQFNHRSRGQGR